MADDMAILRRRRYSDVGLLSRAGAPAGAVAMGLALAALINWNAQRTK